MTLTPKDKETLAQMLVEHRARLGRALQFCCGACHARKMTAECQGIYPFFPKKRHKTNQFATYAICRTCAERKNPEQVYEGVATHLASNGFFVK